MYKFLSVTLSLAAALMLAGLAYVDTIAADETHEGPIKVTLAEAASEFPAGIRFRLRAESEAPITSVAVRIRSVARSWGMYEFLNHGSGKVVDARLFWQTIDPRRYIPPGALLHVSFEIKDSAGNFHETGFEDFVYEDSKFEWKEVTSGSVTVAYHGPIKRRANAVLNTVVQTLETMAPILGSDPSIPIRATVYNNYGEMLAALPIWTRQIGHELVAEGQAFGDFNTLTASREWQAGVGHGRPRGRAYSHAPGWRRGREQPYQLGWTKVSAEFGNPAPGFSYDIALEFALETDLLLPVVYWRGLPEDAEEIIIFYGQAKSIVSYMIFTYGPDKIRLLLSELKRDVPMDDALKSVYGFGLNALDNSWRAFVGAPEYVAPEVRISRPDVQPLPTIEMYTLATEPVAPKSDSQAEEPVPKTMTDGQDLGEVPPEVVVQPASGGCNSHANGATGMLDISAAVMLAWLFALAALRRRRGTLC